MIVVWLRWTTNLPSFSWDIEHHCSICAVKELQSLGLSVEVLNQAEERVSIEETSGKQMPELGINLAGFEGEEVVRA